MKKIFLLGFILISSYILKSCGIVPPEDLQYTCRAINCSYDLTSINWNIDGELVSSNLQFSNRSEKILINGGSKNIIFKETISQTEIYNQNVQVEDLKTFFVIGPKQNGLVEMIQAEGFAIAPTNGNCKIRFANMSPDAPTITVKDGSNIGQPIISNVQVKTCTLYEERTGNSISFTLTNAQNNTLIGTYLPVNLVAGKVYTFVSMGTIDENDSYPFIVRLFVDNDESVQPIDLQPIANPAQIMFVQTVPDAPELYFMINNIQVTTNAISFPGNDGYFNLDLTNGNPSIAVKTTSAGSLPMAVNPSLLPNFQIGKKYSIIMNGTWNPKAIEYKTVEDIYEANESYPIIRFVNMYASSTIYDLVVAQNGQDGTQILDIGYRSVSGFENGQSGTYDVKLRKSGTQTIDYTLPNVTLTNGKVYTILAHGKQDDKSANVGLKLILHN